MRVLTCATIAAGFLLGAALHAVGEGEEEREALRKKLRELQILAAKVALGEPLGVEPPPPAKARGGVPKELAFFPVADYTRRIPNYTPAAHGSFDVQRARFGDVGVPNRHMAEELMEFVRNSASPLNWDDGAYITHWGYNLVVYNTPAVVETVRTLLDQQLRPAAHRTFLIQAESVEVPAAFARRLTRGGKKELAEKQRAALDQLIRGGSAKRLFRGRILSGNGQRVLLWHGRQRALVGDAEVVVAEGIKTSDPVVQAHQLGSMLAVKAVSDGGGARIHVEVEFRDDRLSGPVEVRETADAGGLHMPRKDITEAHATVDVKNGAWAVAATAGTKEGTQRLLLIRASLLARKRGGR